MLYLYPLGGTGRGGPGEYSWRRLDCVTECHAQHTDRVARPQHCACIVRVVNVFQHNREVRLTSVKRFLNPALPARGSRPLFVFRRLTCGQLAPICHSTPTFATDPGRLAIRLAE